MSTELIEKPATEYTGLTATSLIAEVLEANLGGRTLRSSDLPWVKIPTGGATRWTVSIGGNESSEKTITGLLVVVREPEHNLWPHSTATAGSLPLLRSLDGRVGHKIGSDYGDLDQAVIEAARSPDGTYRWQDIPYCQWQDRIPPRAKTTQVLGVLRKGDRVPLFLRVSSTSLGAVDRLLRAISGQVIPHYRAEVELGLEKVKGLKAEYARLVCRFVGSIDEETGSKVKAIYTDAFTPVVTASVNPVRRAEEVPF